ncbi:hypothetical protein D3C72_2377340 [compost metagenome]
MAGTSRLARRDSMVMKSMACSCTLKPAWRSCCAITTGIAEAMAISVACRITTGDPSYLASFSKALAFSMLDGTIMSARVSLE